MNRTNLTLDALFESADLRLVNYLNAAERQEERAADATTDAVRADAEQSAAHYRNQVSLFGTSYREAVKLRDTAHRLYAAAEAASEVGDIDASLGHLTEVVRLETEAVRVLNVF